jgi:hypothetical protein
MGQQYKYPDHHVWGQTQSCWLVLEVFKVESQNSITRGKEGIEMSNTGDVFEFLMPLELMESITHDWEAQDTINSRLSELGAQAGKEAQQFGSTAQSLGDLKKNWNQADHNRMVSSIADVIRKSTNTKIPNKLKVDTPMAYKDSQRREYSIPIQLSTWKSAKDDVFEPVKLLRGLSCASWGANSYSIELPHIFKVYTKPTKEFLYIETAALISVQPTYRAPYIDGYPSFCDLQLTFREIQPLYKENFNSSGTITTSSSNSGAEALAEATVQKFLSSK